MAQNAKEYLTIKAEHHLDKIEYFTGEKMKLEATKHLYNNPMAKKEYQEKCRRFQALIWYHSRRYHALLAEARYGNHG